MIKEQGKTDQCNVFCKSYQKSLVMNDKRQTATEVVLNTLVIDANNRTFFQQISSFL